MHPSVKDKSVVSSDLDNIDELDSSDIGKNSLQRQSSQVEQKKQKLTDSLMRLIERPKNTNRGKVIFATDVGSIIFSVFIGYIFAEIIRFFVLPLWTPISEKGLYISPIILMLTPIIVIGLSVASKGHYEKTVSFWSEMADLLIGVLASAVVISFGLFALKYDFSRTWAVCSLLLMAVTLPLFRLSVRKNLARNRNWDLPTVVVDDGHVAYQSVLNVAQIQSIELSPIVRVSIDDDHELPVLMRVFETLNDFPDNSSNDSLPNLIVSITNSESLIKHDEIISRILHLSPKATFMTPMAGIPLRRSKMIPHFRNDVISLQISNGLNSKFSCRLKRFFDIIFSAFLLFLLTPIMLVIALVIRSDGGPAFFRHERLGLSEQKFNCLKFRSMASDSDELLRKILASDIIAAKLWESDRKLKNDPRITKIGSFMRRTSLDELPQLINIFLGDMSFVGPRPIVEEEVAKYQSDIRYYTAVRPGLTGLWQVSGRNDTTYSERVRLDSWYVKNWSLWLDVIILCKTGPIVIGRNGAY